MKTTRYQLKTLDLWYLIPPEQKEARLKKTRFRFSKKISKNTSAVN